MSTTQPYPQSSPPKLQDQNQRQQSVPVNYSSISPSKKDYSLFSPCRLQEDVAESSHLLAQLKLSNIKIRDLESRIDSLKIENESLAHQMNQHHDDIQNAKTIHYQFDAKETDYKTQLDEMQHEINSLIEENEHLTKLNKDLQLELDTKTSHFEVVRDGLEQDLNQAKKKLEFERNHGENKRKMEQQYLQNQVDSLKQQNTELQRKSMFDSRLSNNTSSYSFSNDEYIMGLLAGKRRDEIEKLQREKEQFDNMVGDLKQKVQVLSLKNEELTQIIENQEQQIEEQVSEIELLKFEHKDDKLQQKDESTKKMKELKEQYEEHIKELNQQIEDDRKEFDKQIDQAIENETKSLKSQLKSEKSKVKQLQNQLKGIDNEHNEQHQNLKQQHLEHFDNLHEVIENLEQQMKDQKEKYEGQIMHLKYKLQMYEHNNNEKTKQYLGESSIRQKQQNNNSFEIPRNGDNNYKIQYMKQTIDDLLGQIRNKEDIVILMLINYQLLFRSGNMKSKSTISRRRKIMRDNNWSWNMLKQKRIWKHSTNRKQTTIQSIMKSIERLMETKLTTQAFKIRNQAIR